MNNLNPFTPTQHKNAYFRSAIVVDGKLVIKDHAHPSHAATWLTQMRAKNNLPETSGQVFEVWH